jgi:HEPN domain-containing protein
MDIEEIKPWLAVAELDLRAARNCLFGPDPTVEAATYHCQQAAEKLQKATLVGQGIEIPFSHDIRVLVGLLSSDNALKPMMEPLARFTPYATAYRYPVDDPFGLPPAPDIDEVAGWVYEIVAAKEALERILHGRANNASHTSPTGR